jgi:hypothetical protein
MSKDQMDLIEKQAQFIEQMMSPKATVTEKTLRDEFAMAALAGMASDPELNPICSRVAEHAYRLADAMLEARK